MKYYAPFQPDGYYHVVSRATGFEKLFMEDENYHFFLRRFIKYVSPVADTFSYSLLPNHFHFHIQVKPHSILLELYKKQHKNAEEYNGWQHKFVMQRFSNLLNSYTKSFNKRYHRKGALFMDYLRRVEITSDTQQIATVFYIHKNPVHHGYCKAIRDWGWSSYSSLLSNEPTQLQREELMKWFGGKERFINYHDQPIYLKNAVEVE